MPACTEQWTSGMRPQHQATLLRVGAILIVSLSGCAQAYHAWPSGRIPFTSCSEAPLPWRSYCGYLTPVAHHWCLPVGVAAEHLPVTGVSDRIQSFSHQFFCPRLWRCHATKTGTGRRPVPDTCTLHSYGDERPRPHCLDPKLV